MNARMTGDNAFAASVPYINEAQLTEEGRHEAMQTMGMPTDRVQGTHISQLQQQPRDSNGHRSFKIQQSLSNVQDRNALFPTQANSEATSGVARGSGSNQNDTQNQQSTVKGVAIQRTVNWLTQLALEGTPNTQSLAEDCYNDFLTGAESTAMGYMKRAENMNEPEENEDGEAPSQQIANNTMHFKKLERKRKGN